MTLGGLGVTDSPNTTGWPPLVFQGLAPMDQISKSKRQKLNPNPNTEPPQMSLAAINFTVRPSHVQGKQPHLQKTSKTWFLKS